MEDIVRRSGEPVSGRNKAPEGGAADDVTDDIVRRAGG